MYKAKCPYCGEMNDMTEALAEGYEDKDGKFDWTCRACDGEFEVVVEWEPKFEVAKIIWTECQKCGELVRHTHKRENTFPFPKSLEGKEVCPWCYFDEMGKEIEAAVKSKKEA